jgi:uncharacterized membrane protein YdjX (TVP38/TMEM64 family)
VADPRSARLFDAHEQLVELLEWIDAQGAMAAVYFILLM